jgi:hypothetical protein
MTTALSLAGFAVLFALYGVLRRGRPKCSSNCGACVNACHAAGPEDRP